MSSHSHVTANVEIRSISDDDESSVSSFPRASRDETLHDDDLLEYQGEIPQVTTEEMIAEAIRGGPNVNDVNMDGCTNITIGNQTHIKGTVIIRNVLTRSLPEPKPEPVDGCVYNKESDTSSVRQSVNSSETSKEETDIGYREFGKKKKYCDASCTKKRKCIILSIIISILLIISVIAAAVLIYTFSGNKDDPIVSTTETPTSPSTVSSTPTTSTSSTSTSPPTTTPFPLTMIERDEWKEIPNHNVGNMSHPIDEIFVCHTGQILKREFPKGCSTKDQCRQFAVKLEAYFIKEKQWGDLPYNFFLGKDDLLYEGRGWIFDGAFKSGFMGDKCLSIGFLGDYSYFKPTETQMMILSALIEYGIELGYISEKYKIFSQCQAVGLKLPEKTIYEIIQTWEHWSNFSENHKLRKCEDDKKVDIYVVPNEFYNQFLTNHDKILTFNKMFRNISLNKDLFSY